MEFMYLHTFNERLVNNNLREYNMNKITIMVNDTDYDVAQRGISGVLVTTKSDLQFVIFLPTVDIRPTRDEKFFKHQEDRIIKAICNYNKII